MFSWLILLLVGQSVAVPFYRVSIQEYLLPPPPWNPNEKEADVEFINTNGFRRNAVENPVVTENTLDDTITHAEYGSERFPLRDAVEAPPANKMDFHAASLPLWGTLWNTERHRSSATLITNRFGSNPWLHQPSHERIRSLIQKWCAIWIPARFTEWNRSLCFLNLFRIINAVI